MGLARTGRSLTETLSDLAHDTFSSDKKTGDVHATPARRVQGTTTPEVEKATDALWDSFRGKD
jgi:hypothetical protein